MIYPIGYKRNHRQRGPMETIKINNNYDEMMSNLSNVSKTLKTYINALNSIKKSLNDNASLTNTYRINKMVDTVNEMEE